MVEAVTVSDLYISGRLTIPDPNLPRINVGYNADFSAAADITLDFGAINQSQKIGIIRALFMDNGSNPSNVGILVEGTDQYFEVPAYAQGVFKVDANESSRIRLTTDGGATDTVTVTLYNYEASPSVWYRFGAFNNLLPIKAQGTMQGGDDIATSDNNLPIYIGGRSSADGAFVPVRVDALGRLDFATTITVGGVFGSDPMGAPPVNPGFVQAVLNDAGNIVFVQLNANGEFKTHDEDVKTELQGVNSKLVTIESALDSIIENTDKASTAIRSSVASATANTVLLAANTNRQSAAVYNDSTAILYLALGAANASTSDYTVQVQAGGYYEVPVKYTGDIKGIWAAANGFARVTELS